MKVPTELSFFAIMYKNSMNIMNSRRVKLRKIIQL